MERHLAVGRAKDLDLGNRLALEALHDQKIAGRHARDEFVQRQFGRAPQFVHQGPPNARRQHHFAAACVPVAIGVLAGLVDIELVVRALDQGHREAARRQERHHAFDQRGLAAAGPAGESEYLHCIAAAREGRAV